MAFFPARDSSTRSPARLRVRLRRRWQRCGRTRRDGRDRRELVGCHLEHRRSPAAAQHRREGRVDLNPYIQFQPESCIGCAACVRYCDEVEGVSAIALIERGGKVTIGTADQQGLLDSSCELCGGCIAVCPTGAMTEKRALGVPPAPEPVRSTCNFCGVGCQVDLHVTDGRLTRVTSPPPGTTVNDGNLCVKGRFSYEFIHHEERLTKPLIRGEDYPPYDRDGLPRYVRMKKVLAEKKLPPFKRK